MIEITFHFVLGFIAAVIGAVPFGLVNLSVVDNTLNRGERAAFLVSAGATLIEIVFVLLAVFLGSRLSVYIQNNRWIEFFIFRRIWQNRTRKNVIPGPEVSGFILLAVC
jgi:hypothetical protein